MEPNAATPEPESPPGPPPIPWPRQDKIAKLTGVLERIDIKLSYLLAELQKL
jgi:hypothetical protein